MVGVMEDVDVLAERWADPMNLVEDVFRVRRLDGRLVPYTPYEYLKPFFDIGLKHLDRDRIVLKSRQIGFTTAISIEAIITAMTFEDTEISIISSQYKQARKIVIGIGNIIKNSAVPLPFRESNIQRERIESDTGVVIVPYSSNPSSIRGDASIKVYLDEFAFVPDQQSTLDAVEPKVSRGGQITIVSTPLREDDLFMSMFKDAEKGVLHNMDAFYLPLYPPERVDLSKSLYEQGLTPLCPDISLDRVESVRSKSPERFAQEYLCQPVDEQTAYYPGELIMAGVVPERPLYDPDKPCTFGIDTAVAHDRSALVVTQFDGRDYNVVHIEILSNEYEQQLKRIRQLFDIYRPKLIRHDKTGAFGAHIDRELGREYGLAVEGVNYTNAVKNEMASRLKMYLQNAKNGLSPRIRFEGDPELLSELRRVRIEITKTGLTRVSGKHGGGGDDIVNALWLSLPEDVGVVANRPVVSKAAKPERNNIGWVVVNKHKKSYRRRVYD